MTPGFADHYQSFDYAGSLSHIIQQMKGKFIGICFVHEGLSLLDVW